MLSNSNWSHRLIISSFDFCTPKVSNPSSSFMSSSPETSLPSNSDNNTSNETTIKLNHEFPSFTQFLWGVIRLHMTAYILADFFFPNSSLSYQTLIDRELSHYIRTQTSAIVPLGPLLQCINGFFISVYLFPFRKVFLAKGEWPKLFLLILGSVVFSPQAAMPGSFEGLIYLSISLGSHLSFIPKLLLYAFLFSFGLSKWFNNEKNIWLTTSSTILMIFSVFFGIAGAADSIGYNLRPILSLTLGLALGMGLGRD